MITYMVQMTAQPGHRDELLARLRTLADAANDEPGTLLYLFHTVDGEPDLVVSYEVFADSDALAVHRASPTVAATLPFLGPLVASTTAWRGAPVMGKGLPVTS